jgi:hypothetical protein
MDETGLHEDSRVQEVRGLTMAPSSVNAVEVRSEYARASFPWLGIVQVAAEGMRPKDFCDAESRSEPQSRAEGSKLLGTELRDNKGPR